jgi:hypothetical protein
MSESSEGGQAIQLIPGGGWMVEHTDDDGTRWGEPILAWALNVGGAITPLVTDSVGWVDTLAQDRQRSRIYHPAAYEIDAGGQRHSAPGQETP